MALLVAPLVEAATLYDPVVVFAVHTEAVATPLEFVMSVSVFVPFPKLQLALEEGAVNVTDAPLSGDPLEVTVACSCVANAVPTCVLWGVPAVAEIAMVGGGGVELELLLLHATRAAIMARPIKRRIALRNFIAHPRSIES